jgi:ABC-type spermidine/putrescine transport system permease subunit I
VLIGFPLAYLIARRAGRWEGLLLVLILIPFWTSFLIRTYAWTNILGIGGPVNDVLMGVGIVDNPVAMLNTSFAVAIGMINAYLPFAVLPIYAVLRGLDDEVLAAAADLGASPWVAFRKVTIPLASAGVVVGFILVLIPAMGEFVVPQILGGGKTLLLGNAVATQFGSSFNWPLGSALAIVGLVMVSLIAFAASAMRRTAASDERPAMRREQGSSLGAGSLVLLFVFLSFLYLPIAIVAINAFNADATLAGWGGFTTEWMTQVVGDPDFRRALEGSLKLAGLSTAFSLAVGTTGALWLARGGARIRKLALPLVMARLVLPEVVLATSLLLWLSAISFPIGMWAAIIGQAVLNSALVTIVVLARLDGRGRATDEAAADLYANAWQRTWRVTLPEIAPAVAAGGLLVFTLCIDDVVLPFFLAGGEYLTLPVLVLSKVRFAVGPEVNAIALLMMLITAVPIAVALWLRRYILPGLDSND